MVARVNYVFAVVTEEVQVVLVVIVLVRWPLIERIVCVCGASAVRVYVIRIIESQFKRS